MSEASLLIGVKKIPVEALLPDKTYAFFSRTSQADEDSMPMLDTILEKVTSALRLSVLLYPGPSGYGVSL